MRKISNIDFENTYIKTRSIYHHLNHDEKLCYFNEAAQYIHTYLNSKRYDNLIVITINFRK